MQDYAGNLTAPSPVTDLTSCDREPIHIPGSIQPHGVLIAFTEADFRIVCVSANLALFAPQDPHALPGSPLAALIDTRGVTRLRAALADDGGAAMTPPVTLQPRLGDGPAMAGVLHRHDGLVILELEPPTLPEPDTRRFFQRSSGAIKRLQAAGSLIEAAAVAAREVRDITGFDRVKIYRFAADFSGEVIAESAAEGVERFLGLHFPASDIPAQARLLYTTNAIRIIPDISYNPVPLVPAINRLTGHPIDLSHAALRSVSPLHCEYMANIGMRGSMSISLLRDGRLWGLIACHHRGPLGVGRDSRQDCEIIAQVLAWQIGVREGHVVTRHNLQGKSIQRNLIGDLDRSMDVRSGLLRNGAALLDLMGATGLCLYGHDTTTSIGAVPPDPAIERLVQFVAQSASLALFNTDRLATLLPDAAAYADIASGVLAVPLSQLPTRRWMLWFRPEVSQTVRWAGNPHKTTGTAPEMPLTPRQSFAEWREQSRGQALAWQRHEIAGALEIRDLVIDVILRDAEQLERVNAELARSNDELESFAFVASHDINEPLRHIEAFAGLLAESQGVQSNARLASMVGGIESSSRRLRNLINDLAEFSRLGRQARKLAPAALEEIAREVIADLRGPIEEAAATIDTGNLPRVLCDRNQMRQVLQNLVSNALKYRHPDRRSHIRIFAQTTPHAAPRICIEDNGIGFDPGYADQVFEPFQRLHGPDEYEGSGIGLAICRKIVQRHGGQVGVQTTPGIGSTFWFSLPPAEAAA
jgi:light-regulated signal transduction histidine kinase (bacteriophytochrome)